MGKQENRIPTDIPRYKKRSGKHAPQKSDHKHDYEFCVFRYPMPVFSREKGYTYEDGGYKIGSVCMVCGKIGPGPSGKDMVWFTTEKNGRWLRTDWSEKAKREFDPATRSLPCFRLRDLFLQKTVDLEHDAE